MMFVFEILPLAGSGVVALCSIVRNFREVLADNRALKRSLHLQSLLLKRSVIAIDEAQDMIIRKDKEVRGTMQANSALSRRNEELRRLNLSGLEIVAELSEKNDALSRENVRLRVLKSSPLNKKATEAN